MTETRKDTIIWTPEHKRRAQELASAAGRSMSAHLRFLVDREYERRQRILVDSGIEYKGEQ